MQLGGGVHGACNEPVSYVLVVKCHIVHPGDWMDGNIVELVQVVLGGSWILKYVCGIKSRISGVIIRGIKDQCLYLGSDYIHVGVAPFLQLLGAD